MLEQLKKLKDKERIIFLRLFAREMVLSVIREHLRKKEIEIEKLKQKLFHSKVSPEEAFKKIIKSPSKKINIKNPESEKKIFQIPVQTNNIWQPSINQTIQDNREEYSISETNQSFSFGRINILINDSEIKSIECSGPNQKIIITKNNGNYETEMVLDSNEISDIINNFSKIANIPINGGMLNASFNNLQISAVVSEFAGSRFIISKT